MQNCFGPVVDEAAAIAKVDKANTDQAATGNETRQGANTDARGLDNEGANTNANSNGPKWQRMKLYYDAVLCAVSVLLLLC